MREPDLDRLFPLAEREGPPASDESVATAERVLGLTFPADYKTFLTRVGSFNGQLLGEELPVDSYNRFFALDEVVEYTEAAEPEDWPFAILGDTGASWKYVLRTTAEVTHELILYDFGSADVLVSYGPTFVDLLDRLVLELRAESGTAPA